MSFAHHHEDYERNSELVNELRKRFDAEREGSAQREFPEGRLSGDDDGSITFKIGADPEKNVVAIEFSKATLWVAMPPQQAVDLAQQLIRYARSISKEPIKVVIH